MRKQNLIKLALVSVAMFFFTGAFAQTYVQGNDIQHDEDAALVLVYKNFVETIVHTTGYAITLYAAPDPVYSPNYDGTGVRGTNLNGTSLWRWVYDATGYEETGTAYEDDGNETEIKDWANQNWVTIAAGNLPAAGASRTYYVKEKFGATGCEAANSTAQAKTITVIEEPDATMVGANTGTAWTQITPGREYYRCTGGVTDDFTLNFTEVGTPYSTYVWQITSTVIRYNANGDAVDAAGAVINDPDDATPFTTVETIGDISAVVNTDFVAAPWAPATPTLNYLLVAGQNVRTKYVFTLSGISSRILALSQKRAGVATAYVAPTVTQTVTYWLNLPPVTGPIYHVPNNFAF